MRIAACALTLPVTFTFGFLLTERAAAQAPGAVSPVVIATMKQEYRRPPVRPVENNR